MKPMVSALSPSPRIAQRSTRVLGRSYPLPLVLDLLRIQRIE